MREARDNDLAWFHVTFRPGRPSHETRLQVPTVGDGPALLPVWRPPSVLAALLRERSERAPGGGSHRARPTIEWHGPLKAPSRLPALSLHVGGVHVHVFWPDRSIRLYMISSVIARQDGAVLSSRGSERSPGLADHHADVCTRGDLWPPAAPHGCRSWPLPG